MAKRTIKQDLAGSAIGKKIKRTKFPGGSSPAKKRREEYAASSANEPMELPWM